MQVQQMSGMRVHAWWRLKVMRLTQLPHRRSRVILHDVRAREAPCATEGFGMRTFCPNPAYHRDLLNAGNSSPDSLDVCLGKSKVFNRDRSAFSRAARGKWEDSRSLAARRGLNIP